MDREELIIAGVLVIIAIVGAGMIFAPTSTDAKYTTIDILNNGDIGENSTLYIKLTDNEKTALSGKTIHIKLTNDKNEVVYDESVKTHATGVAIAQLSNISAGEYTLNVTYDGDGNYTGSSISKKITVENGNVEDNLENTTLIQQTRADSQSSSSSSTSSQGSSSTQSASSSNTFSQGPSSTQSSSSSDTQPEPTTPADDGGDEDLPEYDENGKQIN